MFKLKAWRFHCRADGELPAGPRLDSIREIRRFLKHYFARTTGCRAKGHSKNSTYSYSVNDRTRRGEPPLRTASAV